MNRPHEFLTLYVERPSDKKQNFILETEAQVETTVTDKETVQPIEEASTEEAIVPTGASKLLNKFY